MPNTSVDVNSWEVSACYPQSTFYPLSDGPSIQNHRITKANFRSCSSRRTRSQAPFCFCTHSMISDHAEGTIALLRYSLGGDRPSQTTHHALSAPAIVTGLDFRTNKSGISRLTPLKLASQLHSLHLSYINQSKNQRQVIVKVHGVFPSCRG